MLPSMGDIVIYHFEHIDFDHAVVDDLRNLGTRSLRSRPAIVTEAMADGVVHLKVFFDTGDTPTLAHLTPSARYFGGPVRSARPHHEPTGEVGRVERLPVANHTWSWRPGEPRR